MPEPVTRRMLEFCGLDWNEACLKHEQNPRPVSMASTWQVRQPIYKSSIGRWRDYEPWLGQFRELEVLARGIESPQDDADPSPPFRSDSRGEFAEPGP